MEVQDTEVREGLSLREDLTVSCLIIALANKETGPQKVVLIYVIKITAPEARPHISCFL